MIDIHTHILPLLDDGAQSIEQALDMLVMAYESGTDEIVCTPHMAIPYGFDNPKHKTKHYFEDLRRIVKAEGIPIHLSLGMELLYSGKRDFQMLKEDLTPLNDKHYQLVEFFFDCEEDMIIEAVEEIHKLGLQAVIAHPERYTCVQNDHRFFHKLKETGVLFQMNAGSLHGLYGSRAKACVYDLLDENLIDIGASDAHDHRRRTPVLSKGYDTIERLYGSRKARSLFVDMPYRVLHGRRGEFDET